VCLCTSWRAAHQGAVLVRAHARELGSGTAFWRSVDLVCGCGVDLPVRGGTALGLLVCDARCVRVCDGLK